MSLRIRWQDVSGLKRLENALGRLDGPVKHLGLQRAVNHTGAKALTQVSRTLARQTGLKYETIKNALKVKNASGAFMSRSTSEILISGGASLVYEINSRGGDISLKYFKARETRAGVTAAPFGKRQVFGGTFMKGGRFPNRVAAKGLNGHVYRRTGSARGPLEFINSGVVIPAEMVSGASAKAFRDVVEGDLPKRVMHEIQRLAPGVFD